MILLFLTIAYLLTRLLNLSALPVFLDEALYLRMTLDLLTKNQIWISFSDGKEPLYFWANALFLRSIADSLVAGRMLSLVSGLGTLLATYMLAKDLFGKRAAYIAGVLFIFSPFLLFYNRLAILDSFLTFLLTLFVLFLVKKKFLLAGILLGLALLTKTISQIYLFVIPLYLILDQKSWRFLIKTFAIAILVYLPLTRVLGFEAIGTKNQIFRHNFEYAFLNFESVLLPNLKTALRHWLPFQLGVVPLFILTIGSIWGVLKRNRKIIFLLGLFIFPILIQSFIAKIFFPRYFLFAAVPAILIIAAVFSKLRPNIFLFLLLVVQPIFTTLNLTILNSPKFLPEIEKWQYYYGWPSGNCLTRPLSLLQKQPKIPKDGVAEVAKFHFYKKGKDETFILINNYDPPLKKKAIVFELGDCQQPPKLYHD